MHQGSSAVRTKSAKLFRAQTTFESHNMPAPANTLLIEGSFEELTEELAQYIDDIQKRQNPEAANIKSEITPLLEQGKKDDALKKLVTGSTVLNNAPEKGISTRIPSTPHILSAALTWCAPQNS